MKSYRFRTYPALLTAALVLAGTAWAGHYSGYHDGDDDFDVEIPGMLDFDQRRARDMPDTQGLPNDGKAYCVPTATMNLFAYLANNGYSELEPGPGNWDDPSDMDAYYTITEHIDDLGDLMGTDSESGTTGSEWYAGTTAWIQDYPGTPRFLTRKLVAELYVASDGYDLTTARAAYQATRGLVEVCYGFYDGDYSLTIESSGYSASGTLGSRDGGHCTSFSSARRLGSIESYLGVTDPDSVTSGDDLYSQSAMEVRDWVTDDVTFTDTGYFLSVMQDRTSEGMLRAFDKIKVIRPYWVLTISVDLGRLIVTEISPFASGDVERSFALPAAIRDATMRSDQLFAAVVTRDAGSAIETAWLLDVRTGELRRLVSGTELRVAFSRFQELYVASGQILRRFDVDRGVPEQLGTATLPIVPRAIEWNDDADELWALDGQAGGMLTLSRDMQVVGRIDGSDFNIWLSRDPGVRMTALPGGRVALLAPERGAFATFERVENRLEERARHDEAYDAMDLSATDAGNLVVTMADGSLAEFRDDGFGNLVTVDRSPSQGLRSGGTVESARSRTNSDPELHDGPRWRDR
jgi:hypothetical protein